MADPYWSEVKLLLHCDGSDGATTFTDSSAAAKTVTANGNAQTSTTQSKFGGASAKFDGAGDYLNVAEYADFAFGTGDFTVEFFAWKSANGTNGYDSVLHTYTGGTTAGGYNLELSATRGFFLQGMGATIISYATNPNDSAWHHWALAREGSTIRMFKDGVTAATATSTHNFLSQQCRIGGNAFYSEWFNGFIEEFRVTKGTARYTADFTPPSAPFDEGAGGGTATGLNAAPTFGTPTAIADRFEQATGFSAAPSFGTPAAIPEQIGGATGLDAAPTFGTPMGNGPRWVDATGLASAASFGTPLAVFDQTGQASALDAAPTFGTPMAGRACQASSVGRTTTLGTPFVNQPRTFQASGFSGTEFGQQHIAIRTTAPRSSTARHVHAYGLRPVVSMGSPTGYLAVTQTAVASALESSTVFGTPSA